MYRIKIWIMFRKGRLGYCLLNAVQHIHCIIPLSGTQVLSWTKKWLFCVCNSSLSDDVCVCVCGCFWQPRKICACCQVSATYILRTLLHVLQQ